MTQPSVEFGFVAALEREVTGIVRGWPSQSIRTAAGMSRIFRMQNAALICAGTGVTRAYSAAKVLVEECAPRVLISIGFAGSCVAELRPGSVLVPETLYESPSGDSMHCAFGRGKLVTVDQLAGKRMKSEAQRRFQAQAIEMEAAGVARAAAECGKQFAAIKAISDGVAEELDFLAPFITPEGFATARFVAHIALRPGLWRRVAELGRNSRAAAQALSRAVNACIAEPQAFAERHSVSSLRVQAYD